MSTCALMAWFRSPWRHFGKVEASEWYPPYVSGKNAWKPTGGCCRASKMAWWVCLCSAAHLAAPPGTQCWRLAAVRGVSRECGWKVRSLPPLLEGGALRDDVASLLTIVEEQGSARLVFYYSLLAAPAPSKCTGGLHMYC